MNTKEKAQSRRIKHTVAEGHDFDIIGTETPEPGERQVAAEQKFC